MKLSSQKRKELSADEIKEIFKEMKQAEKIFSPLPAPVDQNIANKWVVTGGSSKPIKLIEVSTWQTGLVS